jgi:DNA-directed RNA polymerase subunit M
MLSDILMAKRKKQRQGQKRKAPGARRARAVQEADTRIGGIEFCPKCGSITVPVRKGKSVYLKCRGCSYEKKKEVRSLKITEAVKKRRAVAVLEKDISPLPLTEKMCPRCEHPRSHWWLQQTRSADEPPTQFFRCERCKHTWREYK